MNRRHMMAGCCAALGAGLFSGLVPAAARVLFNPCRGRLPPELAQHDLVLSASDGLDASRLVDTHAHLLGTGDSGSGCSVHPSMHQWWHPAEVLRRKFILNAACVPDAAPSVDRAYVQRHDRHARLLHGSDHPLPGVMLRYSAARLQRAGLLEVGDVETSNRVREHNPLLFDLLLKRRLRAGSAKLSTSVFEAHALRTTVHAA